MSSTISAARQALYTMLSASPPVATEPNRNVQVVFGDPLAYEEQEVISLRGISSPNEALAVTSNIRHDETFGIELTVKAYGPQSDAPTVDARGFALAEYVRGVVDADVQLSSSVAWSWVSSQRTEGAQPAQDGGWVIFIDLTVSCHSLPTT